MESLTRFIEDHFLSDKSRSSFSNLIKRIKLENEFFIFIENYLNFGTFKQKLYHFLNKKTDKLICPVCNINELNWVEKDSKYRTTCSIKCAGRLTGKKNNPKRQPHPKLNTKDEFIKYFNSNKIKLSESSLSKIYPELVISINNSITFYSDNFPEKVYCYLHELISIPVCKHCNYNTVSFDTFSKGYHDYCSVKCSSNSVDKKNQIKKTCFSKYGVENIGLITRDKALKTMIEKYGSHVSKTEQYKNKYKETCLERYGEEHIFKTKDFKNNMNYLFIEKYGHIHPMKNKDIVVKSLLVRKKNGNIYKWTEEELKDIQSYRRAVSYYTEKTYEEYKYIINPDNLERGVHTNHIDHIFPVIEGWKNKIDPKLISHYKNLRLIDSYENLSKGERTNFSIQDFLNQLSD
jgi:hypothetical protein